MKSVTKSSAEIRKSLQKRVSSSQRLPTPHSTPRPPIEPHPFQSKSQTLRMPSAKNTKINNFFTDRYRQDSALRASRPNHKKHKTAKLSTRTPHELLLLKRSDKMKLIFWQTDPALTSLPQIVVSADYIVDQDCFWGQKDENEDQDGRLSGRHSTEGTVPAIIREWKQLHKHYFVIWTVRNSRSWTRIQLKITQYSLPVHAIFHIKRRKHYTVDYSCIAKEIDKQKTLASNALSENIPNSPTNTHNHTLTIFEIVKVNIRDTATYNSYHGRVPVLLGKPAKAVLMRNDAEPPGLDPVLRCLQKLKKTQTTHQPSKTPTPYSRMIKINSARRRTPELYISSAFKNYIAKYLQQQRREQQYNQAIESKEKEQDWLYEEDKIDQKIESMKRSLIEELINANGRHYQFEGGLSIYNFVGEMFKRNHNILFDYLVESTYLEEKRKTHTQHIPFTDTDNPTIDLQIDYYEMDMR